MPLTPMSSNGKKIPQAIQDSGCEIRTFLPKWGNINERRNQLHEVIRLSGMNIIIDDTDHPLIIKVASLQSARMQVYFIDNEDFFQKRLMVGDKNGNEYTDNYERSIFYARSVLVIHCQGWISAATPFFIKAIYKEEQPFANTKVVYSLYDNPLTVAMPANIKECLAFRNMTPQMIADFGLRLETPADFEKFAINFCDGVIASTENANQELLDFAASKNISILPYAGDEIDAARYLDFYDTLLKQ